MDMPKWISDLIDKGGSVEDCINLWKDIQATEREERAASREMKRAEMENTLRIREIAQKEEQEQEARGNVFASSKGDSKYSKLPKFAEGHNVDVFLKSFEKLATLHRWAKSKWPIRIVPLLSGKALEAYARLDDRDSGSYDKIKEAILKRYELTAEAYRDKFRSATQEKDESFSEYRVRLEKYLVFWCEREDIQNNFERFYDLVLREQLLTSCSKSLRLQVNEHKPKTSYEVVDLATFDVSK